MEGPSETPYIYDSNVILSFIRYVFVVSAFFCFVIFIFGVTGNTLVIWIAGFKMKSVNAVWFLNLALTDLICNIALLLRVIDFVFFPDRKQYTKYLCTVSTCLIFFNMLASVYFLTLISIDRCVCIMWPLWAKVHRTRKCAKIISIVIWMLCLIFTVPFLSVYKGIPDCYINYYVLALQGYISVHLTLVTTRLLIMFVVPFIILISYSLILLKLATLKSVGQSRRPRKSLRPLKVITALVACFFICWGPYNFWPLVSWRIINLLGIDTYFALDFILTNLFVIFAYSNSCINPLLYVFFCPAFKDHLINAVITRLKNTLKNMSNNNKGVDSDRSESNAIVLT